MGRNLNPRPQFFDDAGDPLVSGKVYYFESGTDTPKGTFADVNLIIPNPHPVILTGDGRLPNVFFNGTARQKLTDSTDVQIWDIDPVGGDNIGANFEDWNTFVIYASSDIVQGSDDKFYKSFTDANESNDPTTSPAFWEEIEFLSIWNTNVTYAIGNTVKGSDNLFYVSATAGNQGNDPTSDIVNWDSPFGTDLGGAKLTNVGDGTARTDGLNVGQAQDGGINWVDGGGTSDAITATYSPALTALIDGQLCYVRASAANVTTTPTFSPNALTAHNIVKTGGSALVAGDIVGDGHELVLRYDLSNTRWEFVNAGEAPATTTVAGVVEKSTSGENVAGTSDTVFPSVAGVAEIIANLTLPLLHVRDQKTSGSEGGASSAATAHTRTLNVLKTNEITGASLGSNQITLPAGTYEIDASAPALASNQHKAYLYNITDAADEVIGQSSYTATSTASSTRATVKGRFTIAAEKVFELRHYITAAKTVNGLGVATSNGQVEVYSEVEIRKIR